MLAFIIDGADYVYVRKKGIKYEITDTSVYSARYAVSYPGGVQYH